MWERASELLERADKVQCCFFHLSQGGARECGTDAPDVSRVRAVQSFFDARFGNSNVSEAQWDSQS